VMALFPESVAVGAQFGVIVVPTDGRKVEVATFRADVGYSDGRHPDSVVYARTPKEDAQRRDFTINGLLMRHDTGEVLDYVGGQADLQGGVIRAIGEPDRRFREDKLRLLRAVRFAARFGFSIEAATLEAIRLHAKEITQVSAERERDELTKLLTEGAARRGFELLEETGLLEVVLPEISALKGVQQPPQFHPEGDVFVHTLLLLENLPVPCSPALAGGAAAIVEWFKGGGLVPFLEPLDAPLRAAYLERYTAAVARAYPTLSDGSVLLPFPRLFMVAIR